MRFALSVAAAFALAAPAAAARWAVIAAGSSGFYNYRHQADACHAYQIVLKSGVPAENIILMMADDVANAQENPIKGKLINKPNGGDVYAGCKIDYKGEIVTKQLFMDVVTGQKKGSANGKVLKSTAEDEVFLYFVDHGGVGIIAFPYGEPMTQTELKTTLATLKTKNMYKELVFYMEACESGSMFDGKTLPSDVKVLAVTAANDHESSWGFYCPPNDKVNGTEIGSCLGDLFSIAWMEDSDSHDLSSTTFASQIQRVTSRTNKSHVQQFGDKAIEKETIGTFELAQQFLKKAQAAPAPLSGMEDSAVPAGDVEVHSVWWKVQRATTAEAKAAASAELQKLMARRASRDQLFQGVVSAGCANKDECSRAVNGMAKSGPKVTPCHEALVSVVHKDCADVAGPHQSGWDEYSMTTYSKSLAALCQASMEGSHGVLSVGALETIVSMGCKGEAARLQEELVI